ncbi:MAG: hypothetical protein KBC36_11690 [Spirochaetia bacterium]|nr:hypothetical protein [Spirochaetia bacterium]
MNARSYFIDFLASPVGIGTAVASVALGAVVVGVSGLWLAGLGSAAAAFAVSNGFALLTGAGPRAAAREAERRMAAGNRAALASATAARDRLATLRVADPDVAKAVSLCALRASAYLAACDKAGTRDPRADLAAEECVNLVGLYLEELDDASTEKRFDLADDAPFADAKARVLAALRERAEALDRAAGEIAGVAAPVDRMAAREELR